MNLTELDRSLRTLRLSGMANALETRMIQARAEKMDVVDFLSVLVSDELQRRGDSLLERRLKLAQFRDPGKTLDAFDTSFNPPALRVAAGDVVDVRGGYSEFAGPSSSPFAEGETLPELVGGTVRLRFEGSIPEPVTIPLSDLSSYDTGRKWLGILVRVENVKAQSDGYKSSSGRFSVRLEVAGVADNKLPTINNALMDVEGTQVPFTTGTEYASVVGVVQFFYNFSISPRTAEDITPL